MKTMVIKQDKTGLEIIFSQIGDQFFYFASLKNIGKIYHQKIDIEKNIKKIKGVFHNMFDLKEETKEENEIIDALIDSFTIVNLDIQPDDYYINLDILIPVLSKLYDNNLAIKIANDIQQFFFNEIYANKKFIEILDNQQNEDMKNEEDENDTNNAK